MINLVKRKVRRFRELSWRDRGVKIRRYPPLIAYWLTLRLIGAVYLLPALGLRAVGVRFLYSRVSMPNFGHLALDPYLYLKNQRLNGKRPLRRELLVIPRHKIANEALLGYWRRYFRVVTNPLVATLLAPFNHLSPVRYPIYSFDVKIQSAEQLLRAGPAIDEILERYDREQGDAPIMTVDPGHLEQGRQILAKLGMPEGAWFVCLHVRESGYYGSTGASAEHRNSDPADYLEAVNAIIDRGGWVVRIGDPTMQALPFQPGLIDLTHSDFRSDWFDIMLLGSCRFLLGDTSGPTTIALLFRRPVASANWIPMGHGLMGTNDLYIPKLYQSTDDGRLLTFDDVLGSSLRDWWSVDVFSANQVTWVDNSPIEIRDLALEMIDRLDNTATYTPQDRRLQSAYRNLLVSHSTAHTWGTLSRVGRDFLRSHASMFEETIVGDEIKQQET